MQDKHLHIISFDNPYPPNYGGTIEVFYKVKALYKIGYKIHLHCFISKDIEVPQELKEITQEVYFYKFGYNPFKLFSSLPFAVVSRNNKELLINLQKRNAPILFESLKTTFLVSRNKLEGYKKILRLHNIEHDYMSGISSSETNLLKKILYSIESRKYKKYETVLHKFDEVVTLSAYETAYIKERYSKGTYIPVFHGNDKVEKLLGFGEYALYHGDLRISDNKKSAAFVVEAFKEMADYKLIIASGSGGKYVRKLIGESENISFVRLDGFEHLKELLQKAHINIVWSLQRSGTKLKLLNALFYSRFCVVNNNIMDDANVKALCVTAATKTELIKAVDKLFSVQFEDSDMRGNILEVYLNDEKNASLLSKAL